MRRSPRLSHPRPSRRPTWSPNPRPPSPLGPVGRSSRPDPLTPGPSVRTGRATQPRRRRAGLRAPPPQQWWRGGGKGGGWAGTGTAPPPPPPPPRWPSASAVGVSAETAGVGRDGSQQVQPLVRARVSFVTRLMYQKKASGGNGSGVVYDLSWESPAGDGPGG